MRMLRLLMLVIIGGLLWACGPGPVSQDVGGTPTAGSQSASVTPMNVPTTPVAAVTPSATPTLIATATVAPTATPVPPTATSLPPAPEPPAASATPTRAPTNTPTPTTTPLDSTGADAGKPLPPTPTMTNSDDAGKPLQPTPTATAETSVVTADPGGVIFFLDPDGATIKTIHPDGTSEHVLLEVPKEEDQVVGNLAADPAGRFLLYSVDTMYYLVEGGVAEPLGLYSGVLRWSPDGKRFVGAALSSPDEFPVLSIYDVERRSATSLGVQGFAPDWFPDGERLVYTWEGNVWSYDLRSQAATALTDLPTNTEDAWAVQEAHVMVEEGEYVIFFGGEGKNLGASGNGQQWWYVPSSGGEPQPYTDPNGNFVAHYTTDPAGGWVTYVEGAHGGACISVQRIMLVAAGVGGGVALQIPVAEMDEQNGRFAFMQGVSWAPDNDHLAFAVQPYTCTGGEGPLTEQPIIYTWSLIEGTNPVGLALPTKLVEGLYPVWTK